MYEMFFVLCGWYEALSELFDPVIHSFSGFLSYCFSQQTESKYKIFINIIKKI
jgi:hypothetical protein